MGRKPIHKKAMTDSDRQQRRRKKLRKEKLKRGTLAEMVERLKHRIQAGEDYIPMPPGITYWVKAIMTTADGGEREVYYPKTRPLAAMKWSELEDADLNALLEAVNAEVQRRRK